MQESPQDLGKRCRDTACVTGQPTSKGLGERLFSDVLNHLDLRRENKGLEASWVGSSHCTAPDPLVKLVPPLPKQELRRYLTSNVRGLSNNETH